MEELQKCERIYNVVVSLEATLKTICVESRKKAGKGMFNQLHQVKYPFIMSCRTNLSNRRLNSLVRHDP
eukprot:1353112-Amorphochlora_amoeboformis.AAC.2